MSVVIEPISQLTFQRPLTETSKEILYVRNPGTEPVSFKVKTTAPRQYCVRPNAGRIEPDAQVEVQVILQPFKEEPPLDYKCRDKFLVQTAVIKSAYETLSTADMWTHLEANDKASIQQFKIKCVYAAPTDAPAPTAPTNAPTAATAATAATAPTAPGVAIESTAAATEPKSVLPATAIPSFSTPATTVHTKGEKGVSLYGVSEVDPQLVSATETHFSTAPVVVSMKSEKTAPSTLAPAPAPAPTPVPVASVPASVPVASAPTDSTATAYKNEVARLNTALTEAQQQIHTLQQQLHGLEQSNGLRSRKIEPRSDAVHQHLAALQHPSSDGYLPQVVIGVAVFVFIVTYLFF